MHLFVLLVLSNCFLIVCLLIFVIVHVGYKRPIPGVFGGDGKQIELETLTEPSADARSSDPRVFYIHNFLSTDEADEFVRFSTAEENPYKMAPSTGGTHKAWNQVCI